MEHCGREPDGVCVAERVGVVLALALFESGPQVVQRVIVGRRDLLVSRQDVLHGTWLGEQFASLICKDSKSSMEMTMTCGLPFRVTITRS